jgi:hypothetical protein
MFSLLSLFHNIKKEREGGKWNFAIGPAMFTVCMRAFEVSDGVE